MQAATKKTQKLVTREHKRIGPGQIILLFLVFLFTVFCFAPVLLVFISAFTDESFDWAVLILYPVIMPSEPTSSELQEDRAKILTRVKPMIDFFIFVEY